jgi:soluble calcium-activated nucleotidase 1
MVRRWVLAGGDGERSQPFKSEWATVRDGRLWVGSVGKPWFSAAGEPVHRDAEWVKTIGADGRIHNHDWGQVYAALRRAANVSDSGYLWHEAVHWDPLTRRWVLLPRKRSPDAPWTERSDETRGTNVLLVADDTFSTIDAGTVGPLEPEWGFTSVRKLPGARDIYVALKVREVSAPAPEVQTKLGVFDLSGRLLLTPSPWADLGRVKFEGLEFGDDGPESTD